jgi:1,4-alpha-glucan branching enzyme
MACDQSCLIVSTHVRTERYAAKCVQSFLRCYGVEDEELQTDGGVRKKMRANPHQFGPVTKDGTTRFSLWAPKCEAVTLVLDNDERHPMVADDDWHFCEVVGRAVGRRYNFQLPDGMLVPDPASRYQPFDVHGPSEVVDPNYAWKVAWNGRPWHEAVIYELHIGAFTEEGTFKAAMNRLDYLARLGITAIEIMPVADFPADAAGAMMASFCSRRTPRMEVRTS